MINGIAATRRVGSSLEPASFPAPAEFPVEPLQAARDRAITKARNRAKYFFIVHPPKISNLVRHRAAPVICILAKNPSRKFYKFYAFFTSFFASFSFLLFLLFFCFFRYEKCAICCISTGHFFTNPTTVIGRESTPACKAYHRNSAGFCSGSGFLFLPERDFFFSPIVIRREI